MKKLFSGLTMVLFCWQCVAAEPAEILVLGTFHFANPQADTVKTEVFNVMTENGQQQVLALVEKLNRFRPTKVLLEFTPDKSDSNNQQYQAYLNDEFSLTSNEIHQLGFRLAQLNQHPRIHGIDDRAVPWLGDGLFKYAQAHAPEADAQLQQTIAEVTRLIEHQQQTLPLLELMRVQNSSEMLSRNLGFYVAFNDVGAGDGFAGASSTASWFERNIRMHGLIQQYAQPGERLLVIVGAGHAAILNILLDYDPRLQRVDVLSYLQ